jgi:MFS family permease
MIRFARTTAVVSIAGYVMLMTLLQPDLRDLVNANRTLFIIVNVAGGLGGGATIVGWFVALYHWGTRFEGSVRARRGWGLALILGMIVGGWFYCFFGMKTGVPERMTRDARHQV